MVEFSPPSNGETAEVGTPGNSQELDGTPELDSFSVSSSPHSHLVESLQDTQATLNELKKTADPAAIAAIDSLAGDIAKIQASELGVASLPAALSAFQDALYNNDMHVAVDTLVSGAAVDMTKAMFADQSDTDSITFLKRGADNWATTDGESVFLISRRNDEKSLTNFRARASIATFLNEGGLQQPELLRVESEPLVCCSMSRATGEPVMDLWQVAEASGTNPEQQTLTVALVEFGALLREIAERPIEGFGQLKPGEGSLEGTLRSEEELLRPLREPFVNESPADTRVREFALASGALTTEELATLKDIATVLTPSGRTHGMLVHLDPHPYQFLYDAEQSKINALDWDNAIAGTPALQLSLIYDEWVLNQHEWQTKNEANFDAILRGFEPDETARDGLVAEVISISALRIFEHARWFNENTADSSQVINQLGKLRTALDTLSDLQEVS